MRKFIYGVAVGILCALVVAVIRQQQEAARSKAYLQGVQEKIAVIRRDMEERSEDSARDAEDIHRSFNEINQTISHISTIVNDRRRVN